MSSPAVESKNVAIDMAAIGARLAPLHQAWDEAVQQGMISQAAADTEKGLALREAINAASKAALAKAEGKRSEEFSQAYVDRNAWVKDLQNCRDMWHRHFEAVRNDKEGWEKKVLDTYMAKARSGTLSPLLALIGQYLLFVEDPSVGREHLLEILFLQDPSMRLRTHNWYVLDHTEGMAEIHGPKVERLEAPLFPDSDPLLRELNAKLLANLDVQRGGETAHRLNEMFAPEWETLYKGGDGQWLSAYNPDGSLSQITVDANVVHEACVYLDNNCKNATSELWAAIRELREQFAAIKPVPQQYYNGAPSTQRYGRGRGQGYASRYPSYRRGVARGNGYRRYGGEAEEGEETKQILPPKNESRP